MDLDEIVEKWGRIGLLDGLPEYIKIDTALSYEKVSKILLRGDVSYNDFLVTAIFPIIYKISKTGLKIKNLPDLIEKFNQFTIDNMGVFDERYNILNIDVEAEMCRIFSEDYIQWIKDNPELDPIRYIPKHKL